MTPNPDPLHVPEPEPPRHRMDRRHKLIQRDGWIVCSAPDCSYMRPASPASLRLPVGPSVARADPRVGVVVSDGTRFVVCLMTAWAGACLLVTGLIVLLYAVLGWGVFA